jgi:hypothetical protein
MLKKNLTEKVNDTAGRQFRAQRRETDEIAEQNGRFSDAIGDDHFAIAHTIDDTQR